MEKAEVFKQFYKDINLSEVRRDVLRSKRRMNKMHRNNTKRSLKLIIG